MFVATIRKIRSISSEVSLVIVSRKNPLTSKIFGQKLPNIQNKSVSEIAEQIGIKAVEASSFLDNLEELGTKLIAGGKFKQLTLKDFL